VLPVHVRLLAAEEAALEGVLARLRGLGLPEERVQQLVWHFPGILYEFGDEQLSIAERVFERRRGSYSAMGSYEV
jgi:hypothetical protein